MSELLWHVPNIFQFAHPCRCWGGGRPNHPSVGLLFPAGPSEVVRGVSFVEEFPPFSPFVTCLLQPNGEGGFHWRQGPVLWDISWGRLSPNCHFGKGVSAQQAGPQINVCTVSWADHQMGFSAHCWGNPMYVVSFPGKEDYSNSAWRLEIRGSLWSGLRAIFYVSSSADFLQLLLFTGSVVLRSPEGPQNCSLTVWSLMLRGTLSL